MTTYKVKDDSFDNTVLVRKQINAYKSDVYPLNHEIHEKMKSFWTMLKSKELISNKKYERLTRTSEFSDDELAGFINRQLVETRQATKVVADLIKLVFGDETRVVYVKAGLTSDFRQKFDIYKFRELNDYHHAHDGYLNIIVGNIYNTKFTNNPYNFIKERKNNDKEKNNGRFYNLRRIFDFNSEVWNKEEMIPKIERYIYKIRPLFTRASYEQKGGFSDQNISAPQERLRALKSNNEILKDISKYGGYNSVKNAYFFIAEYTEKKKRIRSIEVLPIFEKNKIKTKEDLKKYCEEKLKLDDVKILLKKLKYKSLIYSDGHRYFVNSKTSNNITIQNGIQIILQKNNTETFRKIYKKLEELKLRYKSESERENKFMIDLSISLKNKKSEKKLSEQEINLKVDNLYFEFLDKLEKGIFKNIKINLLKYLKEIFEKVKYEELSVYKKSKIIQEIFRGIINQQGKFDLQESLKYHKNFCTVMNKSKILENDFYIINQSPTGLFEKKIYLGK